MGQELRLRTVKFRDSNVFALNLFVVILEEVLFLCLFK